MEEVTYSMTMLNDVEWLPFYLERLFNFKRGSSGSKSLLNNGEIPLVSARKKNNGWDSFVNVPDDKIVEANTLTVNNNGDGGAGLAYLQETKYTATQDVTILSPTLKLSKYTMLFLVRAISMQESKFGFGNKANSSHLKAQRIMLPVNKSGEPNWKFMNDYISEKVKALQIRVVSLQISDTNGIRPISLKDRKWGSFELQQIFNEIIPVKGKKADSYSVGKTPYITTTSFKNGLAYFVSGSETEMSPKNTLTIDPIGGKVFFHPYKFIGRGGAGSAVNILKNEKFEKYILLFLATAIELNSSKKASYGTQLNGRRLRQQKIMLPIDYNDQPDWQFMEDYIKSLPNSNLI